MAERNPAPTLMQIPGVLGWHHAGERIHIRTMSGVTYTVSKKSTPHQLREEAGRLRTRARLITALAHDLEGMGR